MKKGLILLVALSIAVLMSASMLVAQEKVIVAKEKGICKKEMKLTDEQRTKIEEIKMNFRLKMIDLKAEREKLGIMLKKETMKPEPAMKDIEGIVKKMSAVREKIQLAGIEHMLTMRKLLGPEACMGMCPGMGNGCAMAGMHGMSCCGEKGDCPMMCGPEWGMGGERGRPAKRMMRMQTEAPGCDMERGARREGCLKKGIEKEIECKVEIKEEAKK